METVSDFVNGDFAQKVSVAFEEQAWCSSPMDGVERKPLDRIGGEVARATSLVRFLPGKSFSAHTHGGGEEFLILSGVFSDESGDYGPLSYVRNPPGSSHTPHSPNGCVLFVKLCQMQPSGEPGVSVDTNAIDWEPAPGNEYYLVKTLFEASDWYEKVALEKIERQAGHLSETFQEGAEILLLKGELNDGQTLYQAPIWIRYPLGAAVSLSTPSTALYWIKRGARFPGPLKESQEA